MKTLTPSPKLEELAKRYVWWELPAWAYTHPEIFLANIMNLGTWEDVRAMRNILGDKILIKVLKNAVPGTFTPRSWYYWNIKFDIDPVPPLPQRSYQ